MYGSKNKLFLFPVILLLSLLLAGGVVLLLRAVDKKKDLENVDPTEEERTEPLETDTDPDRVFRFRGSDECKDLNYGGVYQKGVGSIYEQQGPCYLFMSGDWTSSEVSTIDEYITSKYPTWTRYRSATKKYNCHSYCWLIRSAENEYWLEDPSSYSVSSKYFTVQNVFSSVKSGDLIMIYGRDGTLKHSAVALSDSYGSTMYDRMNSTLVCSKFGSWGLYQTTLYEAYQYYDGSCYIIYRPT